ncbi:HNH endonuclease [Blastococcus sp. TF02-09]|uniref:HNH endonuclease signature motif containing protein n=1 Tax=Blastococcus sp. TF02-09 TaxID=2250576 RepID=UPI000DEBFEAE|nr:HNH endonuclease signature motif containing protein [Blastococcus sp. TF02-9]RBY76206.1 HNH endonuclease [Blastococcus sp. TF02-9]
MSGSGGVGVAVTVVPTRLTRAIAEEVDDGFRFRPVRLGDLVDVGRLTAAEKTRELQRVVRAESALAAYKAQLVVALADDRSDAADRRHGLPGAAAPEWARDGADDPLPGVSEFFPDELALVLNCARTGATVLAEHSHTLVEKLPAAWAALADGLIDRPRARAFAAELGWPARNTDPRLVAEVEAAGLLVAAEMSVRRLRKFLRRELIRRDPSASERRRKGAARSADVTVHGCEDGMAEVRIFLPAPEAAAIKAAADARARAAKLAGDLRPLGMLRAAFVADAVLRPGGRGESTVSAHVTVIAPLPTLAGPGCDHAAEVLPAGALPTPVEPGEVDGHPITAGQLRDLLTQLDSLCPGGLQAPTGGTLGIALVDPATGALRATVTRPELERLVRRGCRAHPDGDCGCPVLGRPARVDRYRHSPAQERFVRTRDRTCRHPGCSGRAAWADLDHVTAHDDGGPTDCGNLCCLCRRHHRLKTHARGWRYSMTTDGVLTVTTPGGVTRTTRPPGWRVHADEPPHRATLEDPPPF